MNTSMRIAFSVATMLMTPVLMNAQLDRSKAPAPGPAPLVKVGESKNFTLKNGMRVIVVENHKLPVVSVQMKFDHAPIMQGEAVGYQDLVGELLTAGTARKTKEQIDEQVDGLGASLSGASDGLYGQSLKKNFPKLMDLVYEVVTSASFPPKEFEKAKTRMLSGLKSRTDDPDQIATEVGKALTYGKSHPYGEVSTEESMAKATRSQVYAFYQYFFRPESGYLVFVGDITENEARTISERLFNTWTPPAMTITKDAQGHDVVKDLGPIIPAGMTPQANQPRQICFVDRPGSAQSVIKAVFPVDLKPGDEMAISAQVLNTMLGGGVFNARLMQNLREARGYTYGAYSSLDADRWCGAFSASASVRNEVTDSAVTEMMYEIERITNEKVKDDELSLAKSYMAGSFARSLEDPRTVARFALNTMLNGLPKDYYSTYLSRLDSVTADDVLAAAKRFLKPDNTRILVVGDKSQVANKLAPLSYSRAVVYYDTNGDLFKEESVEMPPANMKGTDVLENYLKAIGGRKAVEGVKSVRKEYTADMQGMPITMTESNQAPNKYAMRLGSGAMVFQSIVYDGVRAISGGVQGKKEMVDEELEGTRENGYAFPEAHYADLDYAPLLNGIVEVNGQKAYRVQVKSSGSRLFNDYYSVETGLKIRRVETQASEEGTMQVTVDYKDYKAVDGILFPHTIEQNAGMNFVFTAKTIEVNKPIDPTLFKVE